MTPSLEHRRVLQAMGLACYQERSTLPQLVDVSGQAWSAEAIEGDLLLVIPEVCAPNSPEAALLDRLNQLFLPEQAHWVLLEEALAWPYLDRHTVVCLGQELLTNHTTLPSLSHMVHDPAHKKTAWRLLQQHASLYLKPKTL